MGGAAVVAGAALVGTAAVVDAASESGAAAESSLALATRPTVTESDATTAPKPKATRALRCTSRAY
jgi:hypothetical protein